MAKNGFSMSNRVALTTASAASTTLTADDCGKIIIFNKADGASVSLPSSPAVAGAGWNATFIVTAAVTSNAYEISATDGDYFQGGVIGISSGAAADAFVAGASDDAISMNGTTTGGLEGTRITIYSDGSTWHVNGTLSCSGTPATPFATS